MNKNKVEKFESFFWGEKVTESEFYKKLPYDLCIHLKREDSKNWIYIQRIFDSFKIPMNPSKKLDQPYGAKYLMKWNKMIVDTFFTKANELDLDPLEFTEERLYKMLTVFQKTIDKNKNKIEEIKTSKKKLINKIDQETQVALQSA